MSYSPVHVKHDVETVDTAAQALSSPAAFPVPVICPSNGEMLAPLRDGADFLRRRSGTRQFAGMSDWLNERPIESGWVSGRDLLTQPEHFNNLCQVMRRLRGGADHVVASLAWKTYSYWVIAPLILGYVTARRIPVLDADSFEYAADSSWETVFHMRQNRPAAWVLDSDPARMHEGVRVSTGDSHLLEQVRQAVWDDHLEPLMAMIRRRVRLSERLMRGSLASAIAYVTAEFAVIGREAPEVVAKTFLELFDVADLVELKTNDYGRLEFQRRSCCLALAAERPGLCSSCPAA